MANALVTNDRLDKVGAFTSLLCAVHCFVVGFAFSVLPLVGASLLANPAVDWIFFGIILLIGPWALYRGYTVHRSAIPAVLFALGLGLIAFSRFGFEHHHSAQEAHPIGEIVCSIAGGVFLIAFHLFNRRMAAKHQCQSGCCHSANPKSIV